MRHADTTIETPPDDAYVDVLRADMAPFGVNAVGVAPAEVLERARAAIRHRIAHDLVAGMQFTFRNPERSTDPTAAVVGARSVLVAARPYLVADPVAQVEGSIPGRIARYAWTDAYGPLREALWVAARRLRADGWKAVPFADDNSIVDREIAHRAGLGWFGKNANLLVPGVGSWVVLGCVVTTAPLPPAAAPVPDACGACRRCLDGCPTGAIIAPGVIDAGRCVAWVAQRPGLIPRPLRAAVGDRLYGCDDCQDVCPLSRHAPVDASDPDAVAALDVLDLLSCDDENVMVAWGRRYLADRDPRWVRRNALVVLGNAPATLLGDPVVGPRVRDVLAVYLDHRDAVLRAHAVWAARRLGLRTMLPDTDDDPAVLDELRVHDREVPTSEVGLPAGPSGR